MSVLIKPDHERKKGTAAKPPNDRSAASISKRIKPRLKIALSLAVAITADALDIAFPFLSVPVDLFAACSLLLLHGVRWEIFAVIAPEIFPPTAPLPTWTLLVIYLATVNQKA
jgi:hypothetical protein